MASGGADADEELYALDVATDTFTQLTDDDIRQLFATWSPDGRQIAYLNDYVLWMMEANGSNKHQVAPDEARDLDWSPDGQQIVIERQANPHAPGYDFDLWLVNADGSNLRRLTDIPSMNVWMPNWSPDGKQVAFEAAPISGSGGGGQISVIDIATGATRQLTTGDTNTAPFWVPSASLRIQPASAFSDCTPTSVLYSWEFDATTSPVNGCFVRVKASPEELLGGSARSASLFDPLRADPLVGAYLDTFSWVMAEKWAVELIKVWDGKQDLSDVAWIMLVDIALEAGGQYIDDVLKWRGMQVMHSSAQKHLIIGPTLDLMENWLSARGVDLVRWYEAWQRWPYASMTHRVQLGQRTEEFASYRLLNEYPEAYNYLDKPEVWLCTGAPNKQGAR